MRTLVIDENFKGLKEGRNCYFFDKDIKCDGDIEIKVRFITKGCIKSGGKIVADRCLGSDTYVEAKGKIKVCGDFSAKQFIEAYSIDSDFNIRADLIKIKSHVNAKRTIVSKLIIFEK